MLGRGGGGRGRAGAGTGEAGDWGGRGMGSELGRKMGERAEEQMRNGKEEVQKSASSIRASTCTVHSISIM